MPMIKNIAMYLPQFHRVKENDQWWGDGYTEWVAVKNADRLFETHNQPREPLDDDYYDLLSKKTIAKQAALAEEYGIDGFCFYHYYFKEGRKILEKPAENLLEWKDINMPFCFCWANETWARTWSKATLKNVWSDIYENNEKTDNKNGILLEQKYGREKQWKEHIDYLLPFFLDERYIKYNGAPVFLVYRPNLIACFQEMIYFWKNYVKKFGIKDLHIIGMNVTEKIGGMDAALIHGPSMYWLPNAYGRDIKKEYVNGVRNYSYEQLWINALEAKPVSGCKTYYGGFVDYDDTPRRGKNGVFLRDVTIQKFEKFMSLIVEKNICAGNEYQFINAFNEWGESMYLEPDKKNGYSFLEAIKRIKQKQYNQCEVSCVVQEKEEDDYLKAVRRGKKLNSYVLLMDKWMEVLENGGSLAPILTRNGYKSVAIYGMGVLGRHLLCDLQKQQINIKYVIDKKSNVYTNGVKLLRMSDELPHVDLIIITAFTEYDCIWKALREKTDCSIMSLREMIEEVD